MKRIITIIAALAMCLAIVTTAEAKKPKGEKGDPAAQFDAKDTNKDGFLSKEEYTAGAKDAAKAGTHYDKIKKADATKGISKEEFVAAAAAHKKKDK